MTEEHSPSANEILAHELAVEQAHVDTVYRYLASATAAARNVQAESRAKYLTDRADWMREEDGTALFERRPTGCVLTAIPCVITIPGAWRFRSRTSGSPVSGQ